MNPDLVAEFEQFWAVYPLKEGKKRARDKYQQARKVASAAEILAGLERYIERKQRQPWREWMHAKTWLYGEHWADEGQTSRRWELETCPHTPKCGSPTSCQNLQVIAAFKAEKARNV